MKPSRSVGGISSFLRFTERTYRFFGSKQEPAGFLFRERNTETTSGVCRTSTKRFNRQLRNLTRRDRPISCSTLADSTVSCSIIQFQSDAFNLLIRAFDSRKESSQIGVTKDYFLLSLKKKIYNIESSTAIGYLIAKRSYPKR